MRRQNSEFRYPSGGLRKIPRKASCSVRLHETVMREPTQEPLPIEDFDEQKLDRGAREETHQAEFAAK
jgi:hypothetical protein